MLSLSTASEFLIISFGLTLFARSNPKQIHQESAIGCQQEIKYSVENPSNYNKYNLIKKQAEK
jgi:hypothetical protein